MADVIRKATNRFTKGLVMDFSPENTKNEVLTHALNATLLTFNGNELSLQNDMGNARVETAFLPEGYMPVGTCEYGGVIYIVSYNPLEDKSQIGCFPSPERNISNKELGISDALISRNSFQVFDPTTKSPTGDLVNTTQYVLLKNDNLNPGDKFLICSDKEIYNEKLADLYVKKQDSSDFEPISNPIIALNVVSIEDSGKIVYLNSDIRQYSVDDSYVLDDVNYTDTYKYHILGQMTQQGDKYEQATVDPDDYRNVLSSGYSVFKSKTSGKLAILAELITIDSYSVTHSIYPKKTVNDNGEIVTLDGNFDVVIHTEVSPEISSSNFLTTPKLKYYYLQNSQGYLQVPTAENQHNQRTLFNVDGNGNLSEVYDDDFKRTLLSEIFTPTTDVPLKLSKTLEESGQFNFPQPFTYHGRMQEEDSEDYFNGNINKKIFTKFTEGKFHRIKRNQVIDFYNDYFIKDVRAKFYVYNEDQGGYLKVDPDAEIDDTLTYYVLSPTNVYTDIQRNISDKDSNETLYKLISEPQVATNEEIYNTYIEKYQYVEIYIYKIATSEDLNTSEKLFEKNGDTYTQITGFPESGKTYYIQETKETLKSIGFEINPKDFPGQIYFYPTTKNYVVASEEDKKLYWDFDTYPMESTAPYGCPLTLYKMRIEDYYRIATDNEIVNRDTLEIDLYYKTDYIKIENLHNFSEEGRQLFIVVPMDTYAPEDKFVPAIEHNYIQGYDKPDDKIYPKDDPISIYTLADFIPNVKDDVVTQYEDLRLASIKIPSVISANGLDIPFKYDYTLVPCMNYGKLNHLAVSNTVDFSKLHAFNQSDFTTWKYHIDGNQLRLTFGAEIFDTYETDKVDGLILEFYDVWGFAGSLEITDKKSYSGIFTKIIPLNSLGALSNKRVENLTYNTEFKRNINIVKKDNGFLLNNHTISFTNYHEGWTLNQSDLNDCGTLYSNILYGVKTYLRQTVDGVMKFTKKKEFFLYTLPILNDFYYTVNDFTSIEKPQLDFMLTYKLQDVGENKPYTGGSVVDGYT